VGSIYTEPEEGEMATRPLLTPRETADWLRCSTRTLFDLTSPRGTIPVVRVGRRVRYSLTALQAWIDQQAGGKELQQ
jgi:excisionase family DNA binding protein